MGETVAAGGLEFWVENRRTGEDGGPSLQVRAHVVNDTVQLLRFDMFYKLPHYHYAPNGIDIRYNVDSLVVDDGIGWVISLLRTKLPELLEKAGYETLIGAVDRTAVTLALPGIRSARDQKQPLPAVSEGMHN